MPDQELNGDPTAYEVFARFGGWEKPLQHVGSVRGADPELAWHAAKEAYTRREKCLALWVVPRTCITMSTDDDQIPLTAGARMTYRLPAFPSAHRRARRQAIGASETEDATLL
jgi:ring-1,2-phenylacetyl-CoA epoxidase subunit PaaB